MSRLYHDDQRRYQDRFDTRRLADRLEQEKLHHVFTERDKDLIRRAPMFFLATADGEGRPTCSYKGGAPGFVHIVSDNVIAFPDYDGNGMFLSIGNLTRNPHVGLLFIDFEHPMRVRIHGKASIDERDPLMDRYPGATMVIRVDVTDIFPNCPRYIHKHHRIEESEYVPREGHTPPVPEWKRQSWAVDVLPRRDPEGDPDGDPE